MKKVRRVLMGALIFALVCTLAAPLLVGAAPASVPKHKVKFFFDKDIEDQLSEEQKSQIEAKQAEIQSILESVLTDEQKAEIETHKTNMEAQKANLEEKWNALSEAQKEELYGLHDNTIDSHMAAIDKYLDLGLIDAAIAQDMKDKLTEAKNSMRENGEKGMFSAGYFKMGVELGDEEE
ncbi:MAG: DUF4407 domain-containing protein [Peptococcaceae bacterium]|nr:DUF4407 domain-containing protein [Peptococcaceae bacterium]